MTTFIDTGYTCQCCNKEYPNQVGEDTEYTCPCCQTIDTIKNLLRQSLHKADYSMDLTDIKIIRENLDIINSWLNDVAYLIKESKD